MSKKNLIIFFILAVLLNAKSFSQEQIDILHYKFSIELNDKNDTIYGKAAITIRFLTPANRVVLDLKGMNVLSATGPGVSGTGKESNVHAEKIYLALSPANKPGDTATYTILYKGIPADGLIISRNKFGKRTFFSDNWPNRASHWIPCHDDPADKASVEFIVTAPDHYKVVSNGILKEVRDLPENKKLTHWIESIPLPTKIMVIGVADFAVDTSGYVQDIPVTSWVFPQNKKAGFFDFSLAKEVLAYLIEYIGPYPFKKLANVQSKTIFGGMENASAIFYNESTVNGNREDHALLAHEIAHQWFGDMLTEQSFAHLWLSEGFASYLSEMYIESKFGKDSLRTDMGSERLKVIAFAIESNRPVVDSISSYTQLLNANSYEKGSWVLHMLRRQLGDSIFQKIIRSFYIEYAGKNASTKDFQKVCEKVSGKNLEIFFTQWLYTPGLPKLKVKWQYSATGNNVLLRVEQLKKNLFQFPLEVQLQGRTGKSQVETIFISKQIQEFTIPVKEKTVQVYLDPHTSLLFEGTVLPIK